MAEARQLITDCLPTPIGEAVIVCDGAGALLVFDWEDRRHRWEDAMRRRYGAVALAPKKGAFGHAKTIADYFDGDIFGVDKMAIAPQGTPFQLKVWNALREIPGGTTTSYGALAKTIGKPDAVRAAGHANGQNPISVIVPCHRVIGHNGALTGYGGGLPRKRWLLDHEARHAGRDLFQRKAQA
ncbi:MAG TPA: methylated-DNA--[protein]-cysteine S-methyltransferase [Rhizomicrobium sp.]|nr:methylated-DNA--[protein]-cysteine S-methyltransferase [Rhizomicrobium sp.]